MWTYVKNKIHVFSFLFLIPVLIGVFLFSVADTYTTAAPVNTEVEIPVVMYHSILNNTARAGQYIITPAELECDMKYLKDHGYQTVTMADLIAFVEEGKPLPEKPIMLTFDDGYYNNLSYAYPLLIKYDMKAVISLVGQYTDQYSESTEKPNNNYSHLTWTNAREMQSSGHVEFQNHSYNMHGYSEREGMKRKKNESIETYTATVTQDIMQMQEKMKSELGSYPTTFTYPFGFIEEESEALLTALNFKASLSCFEHISTIRVGDASSLHQLGRFNRPAWMQSEDFFEAVMKLKG